MRRDGNYALELTPLEKAEQALAILRAIIAHDHAHIARQPANGIKAAAASLAAAVDVMRGEAARRGAIVHEG